MARPNKYQTHVEPYLDKIAQMALEMTEQQIAETLGIGYATFRRYKEEHEQLRATLKIGRRDLVMDLKSALIQKAKGFDYTETSETWENGVLIKKEIKNKHAHPDVAAINLLLKNYDKDNWANDPQSLALRKEELELQKKKLEDSEW